MTRGWVQADEDDDMIEGEMMDDNDADPDLLNMFLDELLEGEMDRDSDAEGGGGAPPRRPDPNGRSRVGNSIYVGGRLVGVMSYLLHWQPASFSAKCRVHDDCVCTAHVDRVLESHLEDWLSSGLRFQTAEAHMNAKPAGAYNRHANRHSGAR